MVGIDRIAAVVRFVGIGFIITVLVEQFLHQGVVFAFGNLVIDGSDRLNHMVNVIEIAVVGHCRRGVEHGGIHHVEPVFKVLGIPFGVGEEIVVVLGRIDIERCEQFLGEYREVAVVMDHMHIGVDRSLAVEFDGLIDSTAGTEAVVHAGTGSFLALGSRIAFRGTEIGHLVPIHRII